MEKSNSWKFYKIGRNSHHVVLADGRVVAGCRGKMTARKIKEAIGAASWAKDILAACHAAKAEIEKGSRSTDFVNIYWKVK